VVLSADGVAIDVRYQAASDLGEVPLHMVQQNLRIKLGMPDLVLKAERTRPPRPARAVRTSTAKRNQP
jgi:hypothetical protein